MNRPSGHHLIVKGLCKVGFRKLGAFVERLEGVATRILLLFSGYKKGSSKGEGFRNETEYGLKRDFGPIPATAFIV